MPRKKNFGCIRIWRAFGEQTHPKRRLLYHRTELHHPTQCSHRTEGVDARAAAPPKRGQSQPPRVIISYIHFLGTTKRTQADEFIEIKNLGGAAQDLSGWRISAADPGQTFVFPDGTRLDAGAALRVYTNREPGEAGHFSFASKRAIWNDSGDLGQLFDRNGALVAKYGYGSYETRTIDSIKEASGLSGLEIICDRPQLAELGKYPGKVDFLTALERALRCLLEAPATDGRERGAGAPKPVIEQLNRQRLQLLHAADLRDAGDVKKSWYFGLTGGGGGRYRVVVDRSGAEPAHKEAV